MSIDQLRENFVQYFEKLGYNKHESSSLIPSNDPSVLFTTAGMQQFKDYYTDPSSAPSSKLVTVQPVMRTTDIDEVGDNTHLTQFEMLGNFIFGSADMNSLKKSAITEAFNFLTEKLGVEPARITATIFKGDERTPSDTDSMQHWSELGIKATTMPRADNFWGPTGDQGPCGPTSEIFVDGIEVWNLVFNQYYQDQAGNLTPLERCGLDTGSGLERLATTLQGKNSIWQVEPFSDWLEALGEDTKENRIIADHIKAILFLVSSGIAPANKGREYVLRRLIRRVVYHLRKRTEELDLELLKQIHSYCQMHYTLLPIESVVSVYSQEKKLFVQNLANATGELDRWLGNNQGANVRAVTEFCFKMFESFGLPKELLYEYAIDANLQVDSQLFDNMFAQHQEISRQGLEKQFKGGLADHHEQTIKHHTAHHLLLAALQQILGSEIVQKGSNVTSERLRLDFNFDRKVADDELKQIEELVNTKIKEDLPVIQEEMPRDEALKSGAQAEFGTKYGDVVSVYSIGDFSKELCGGPHALRTGELGHFKILKEEASSQGVRRIKAKLE